MKENISYSISCPRETTADAKRTAVFQQFVYCIAEHVQPLEEGKAAGENELRDGLQIRACSRGQAWCRGRRDNIWNDQPSLWKLPALVKNKKPRKPLIGSDK